MSIDILKKELKLGTLRNLYLFYGPEEYLKKYYIESVEKAVIKQEDLKVLNKVVFEGKFEFGKVIDACETMPVFCDKKIVIVKNSGIFKSKKKAEEESSKDKAKKNDYSEYLKNIPEYTCLVFYETEIDKRMKLVDCIKKNGLITEFALQKPPELVKWVMKVFSSNRKEIDTLVASQLVDNCEQHMNEILNEINKVVLYLGDRVKVKSEDIEKVCTKSIKAKIFDLTDAIAEKNKNKVLKLLDDMVILKEPLPKILFMITRQFRQILEFKLLNSEGLSLESSASRMGITPYAAGKLSKQARGFTVERLKSAIEDCLEYDLAIKTGKIKDRIAAELLIAKFSSE